jgi:hypothetical protein
MGAQARLFSRLPFRRRTFVRRHLPWWLINRGLACPREGDDCEARGAHHEWFNADDRSSRCYHCGTAREGRLWETAE